MMTIESLTTLLGWSTVINIVLLTFTTICLITMRGFVVSKHRKMFGLDEKDLSRAYFGFLANFKLLVIVFNLAPYLALKIMN